MNNFFKKYYNDVINGKEVDISSLITFICENYESFEPNWHALGFIHCKLANFGNETLRLHIWNAEGNNPSEQVEKIHNHLFSLRIYVIVGSVINEIFNCKLENDKNRGFYSYIVKYNSDHTTLEECKDRFDVKPKLTEVVNAGDYYSIDSSVFHRTSAGNNNIAITLVATFDHKETSPITLSEKKIDIGNKRTFYPFDKELWLNILRDSIFIK